ncbi:hypothetical protein ACVBEG_27325, partial [Pseudomonas sp. GG8]
EEIREGAHVYAQSRKDGKDGICYIVINNSKTEDTLVEAPACRRYTLEADALRSQEAKLNGKVLKRMDTLPNLPKRRCIRYADIKTLYRYFPGDRQIKISRRNSGLCIFRYGPCFCGNSLF